MSGSNHKELKKRLRIPLTLVLLGLMYAEGNAQIETTVLSDSNNPMLGKSIFFTNRPLQYKDGRPYTFKNKFTGKSNTLYFCSYNFDSDSIEIFYKANNISKDYPTEKIENNFIYDIYRYHRLERGIKNFYVIVGGYGKSFNKQVNSYMKRLKTKYGDTLFNKALITVFAWGTEASPYQYYRAVRKAKNGAKDFAIFQHMLDEFMSDTVFFRNNPKDFQITIAFSSMGNKLFQEYLERREEQNIPLVKTYKTIALVGSVAPRNVFEEEKAFHNLYEMTDTVSVFVNSKDILLKLSSLSHLRNRIGNKGPKNEENLPGYIRVTRLDNIMTKEDMAKLGHDYILTNEALIDGILEGFRDDPVPTGFIPED
jgi:hypothetical protein